MKILIILCILMFATGCGSEEAQTCRCDITGLQIIGEGTPDKHSALMQWVYDDVVACARVYHDGPINAIPPHIIIVNGPISRGENCEATRGCYSNAKNTIYLTEYAGLYDPFVDWVLPHEIMHRITGIGVEGHDSQPFRICQAPICRGAWIKTDPPL